MLGEALIAAVRTGEAERVREALMKMAAGSGGASIDYMCQAPTAPPIWNIGAMTALMLAAHRQDLPICQMLVDKKANKSVTNHLGRTAADYAKEDKLKTLLAV